MSHGYTLLPQSPLCCESAKQRTERPILGENGWREVGSDQRLLHSEGKVSTQKVVCVQKFIGGAGVLGMKMGEVISSKKNSMSYGRR